MIKELKDMGIELMVSIWPTVDYRSENFNEMKSKGLLIRVDSGYPISMDFQGNTLHYDATNPEAREYVWERAKKNYYDKGFTCPCICPGGSTRKIYICLTCICICDRFYQNFWSKHILCLYIPTFFVFREVIEQRTHNRSSFFMSLLHQFCNIWKHALS